MYRSSPTPSYRDHPVAEIVKGRTATHTRTGERYELRWHRFVYDDGDATDVLRQQHWNRHGVRTVADLTCDYGKSVGDTFERFVELYRKVAEESDGVPPPGQIRLPGLS